LGIDVRYEAEKKVFSISLTGREEQLEPALRLLNHFLGHAKADKEALKELKDSKKVDYKAFGKTKEEVMPAMLGRVMYGQASPYLLQPSLKEVKKLTSEQLLALFAELQQSACQLFYCGKRPTDDIARLAQQCLPLAKAQQPKTDVYKKTLSYDTPTVFFYHVPKSRQNYILTYEQTAPTPTPQQEATAKLWSQYMGEGMSSVLFQNIREYQSLAYSTRGILRTPPLAQHPNDPLCYVTITGTQADKTLQAMSALDSLMRHMPMKEENLEAARQELLSNVQNNYPSFRKMATYIANQRLIGYAEAPDKAIVEQLPAVSTAQVTDFHRSQVAGNHRVWMVIGDRKKTDLKALANYGKIVELKKEDIYK
jgi:predicted Zn-dependent peptidase